MSGSISSEAGEPAGTEASVSELTKAAPAGWDTGRDPVRKRPNQIYKARLCWEEGKQGFRKIHKYLQEIAPYST